MALPRSAVLLAVLVIVPAFAACINPFAQENRDEASMGALFPLARDHAVAWRAGAVLTEATTFEGHAPWDEDEVSFTLPPDPEIGNGHGVLWMFTFADPASGASMQIFVAAANRSILGSDFDEEGGDDSTEVTFRIDSDQAMARAKSDSRFEEASKDLRITSYIIHLEATEEFSEDSSLRSVWFILANRDEDGEGFAAAFAAVDARTGAVLMAGPFADLMEGWGGWGTWDRPMFPPKETLHKSSHSGEVLLTDPDVFYEFPVDEEGASARIVVCHGRRLPAGGLDAEVLDPDGHAVASGSGGGPGPGQAVFELDNLHEGEYVVRLTLTSGAVTDYVVDIEVWTGMDWSMRIPPPFPTAQGCS